MIVFFVFAQRFDAKIVFFRIKTKNSGSRNRLRSFCTLDYQDSNLDKQNQNLLCYHYTIVQTLGLSVKKRGKDRAFLNNLQIFGRFFLVLTLFLFCFLFRIRTCLLSQRLYQTFAPNRVSVRGEINKTNNFISSKGPFSQNAQYRCPHSTIPIRLTVTFLFSLLSKECHAFNEWEKS